MRSICIVLTGLTLSAVLAGCISAPIPLSQQTSERLDQQPPVRFVVTFDDGPSASSLANPTLQVLHSLAQNPVQNDIKAIFFVQTGVSRAGNSDRGRRIMRRESAAGHILGFHSGTAGHTNHRSLSPEVLEQSLQEGSAIIASTMGSAPTLLRPPFWNYDQHTFAAYQRHGLHVLLTDISANDGKIWGFNASPRRRAHMLREMSEVRERIAAGEFAAVDGAIPVVVTFHDLNRYTARHTREYLQILLDSAQATGLKVAPKAFYDDRAELQRAAMSRTVPSSAVAVHLPGLWGWGWDNDSR
ncbi:polysaccharide deacetylase family protein [Pseudomonas caspiana]|uniref:Polysaccharide deacetylase n=1 Tax=Pseudomonas caspiana TaxID=1451454 RepID=A0A1Y3PG12_9PSED|nr:polysaccharide deacetylase family protein [Pseudomonas caspiana]OUM75734.1 polysaccharide deacetylase [Pseudomonas caspiana]